MSILSFSNLSYSYDKKKNVFTNISAEMELGKLYAILGQSGCGKTTLLSLLGGLDSATKGKILFDGEDIMEKGLANHRRNHVSFVFVIKKRLIPYGWCRNSRGIAVRLLPVRLRIRISIVNMDSRQALHC